MTRRWKTLLSIVAVISIVLLVPLVAVPKVNKSSAGNQPKPQAKWREIWSDDFTGGALDQSKWTVFQTGQNHNDELQYYVYDEVWVQNGKLVIRSRQRRFSGSHGTRDFTSGKVSTARKFSFLYGTVEMRAKLPSGRGIWPAFWMLPAHEKSWPPEIDVLEMLGHEPNTIYMSNHHGLWPKVAVDMSSFKGPDFSADYHLYTLEWAKGWLRWKVDGITRKETTVNVPDQPMYLILNTAVGGKWPGKPDKSTVFPQQFSIDYIRVYQPTSK